MSVLPQDDDAKLKAIGIICICTMTIAMFAAIAVASMYTTENKKPEQPIKTEQK